MQILKPMCIRATCSLDSTSSAARARPCETKTFRILSPIDEGRQTGYCHSKWAEAMLGNFRAVAHIKANLPLHIEPHSNRTCQLLLWIQPIRSYQ